MSPYPNNSGEDPFRPMSELELAQFTVAIGRTPPAPPSAAMCPLSLKPSQEVRDALVPV